MAQWTDTDQLILNNHLYNLVYTFCHYFSDYNVIASKSPYSLKVILFFFQLKYLPQKIMLP